MAVGVGARGPLRAERHTPCCAGRFPVLAGIPHMPPAAAFPHAPLAHLTYPFRALRLFVSSLRAPGPSGRALDFSFGARDSPESMDEIGRIVINVCKVVPQGVVVFFPSGAFAEAVSARWAASGALAAISAVKTVFREPKTAAGVEGVLERYAAAALRPGAGRGAGGKGGGGVGALTGAVLLCVVGGKLSEGINFNDGLGRCAHRRARSATSLSPRCLASACAADSHLRRDRTPFSRFYLASAHAPPPPAPGALCSWVYPTQTPPTRSSLSTCATWTGSSAAAGGRSMRRCACAQ